MTTPAGVPSLPIGALAVETLGQRLQDQSATAMRNRAGEQMPAIFGASAGGNILSDLSPFRNPHQDLGRDQLTDRHRRPVDIKARKTFRRCCWTSSKACRLSGQFVQLLEALAGTYDGEDPTLLAIQDLLEPIRLIVDVGQGVADFLKWIWDNYLAATSTARLQPILEWLNWYWELFGSSVESVLKPIFEFLHWVFTGGDWSPAADYR